MSRELPQRHLDSLSGPVGFSIFAHVAVVLFFVVKTIYFPNQDIPFEAAVRVDLVGLPDKINPKQILPATPPTDEKKVEKAPEPVKPEPEKPVEKPKPEPKEPAKPVAKPTVKEPDAINLDSKKKEKSAIDKLKQLAALEDLKKETHTSANKKAPAIKGNAISAGTSLTGAAQLQNEDYRASLDRHVKQYWALPQWLANKNLHARVLVKIDEHGQIIEKRIIQSSGNAAYDDAVIETTTSAAPFPAPPERLVNVVRYDGIILQFP